MQAPDFNKTLRATQRMAQLAMLLLVASNLLWALIYFTSRSSGEERVYVVSDHTTTAASLVTNYKPTIYEGKNHVKNFFVLMHSHDASNYADRINSALKLIDKQIGARLYNKMKQGGILEHYTRFNSRTEVEIDSVRLDMSVEPYRGAIYTRQKYLYDNQSETIPIAADFEMIRTHRSEDNPFGLQIVGFDYKAYNPPLEK